MKLENEVRAELVERIIPFWEKLKDEEHGGFYGYMDFDLNVDKTYEKGCILNSRILWFFKCLPAFKRKLSFKSSRPCLSFYERML